jgi:hypothetical protein
MSHEKVPKEKSDKKTPVKNLKEKRAAKAAKRNEKKIGFKIDAFAASLKAKN